MNHMLRLMHELWVAGLRKLERFDGQPQLVRVTAVNSGHVAIEDDRVIAMYHGTRVGNMVAVSSDPLLLNWEKVTGEAVIPMTNPS